MRLMGTVLLEIAIQLHAKSISGIDFLNMTFHVFVCHPESDRTIGLTWRYILGIISITSKGVIGTIFVTSSGWRVQPLQLSRP